MDRTEENLERAIKRLVYGSQDEAAKEPGPAGGTRPRKPSKGLSEPNRAAAEAYLRNARAFTSPHTTHAVLRAVAVLDKHLEGRPILEATEADMRTFTEHLLATYKGSTPAGLVEKVRAFFGHVLGEDAPQPRSVQYLAAWRRKVARAGKCRPRPKRALTPEQVLAMVNAAQTERDKGLVMCLFDLGWRVGALRLMDVGGIRFEHFNGVELADVEITYRDGETARGQVLNAVPILKRLLNSHPDKSNPASPFWIVSNRPYDKADPEASRISYQAVYKLFTELGKRAGVGHVTPHIMRHSRATDLAKRGVASAVMEDVLHWRPGSRMARTYVHLAAVDTKNALLRAHGVKTREETMPDALAAAKCPRCKGACAASDAVCQGCGWALDPVLGAELERRRTEEVREAARQAAREEAETFLDALMEQQLAMVERVGVVRLKPLPRGVTPEQLEAEAARLRAMRPKTRKPARAAP